MKHRIAFCILLTLPLLCGWGESSPSHGKGFDAPSFGIGGKVAPRLKEALKVLERREKSCRSCVAIQKTRWSVGFPYSLCEAHKSAYNRIQSGLEKVRNEEYACLSLLMELEEEKFQLEKNLAMCDQGGGWFSSNKKERYFLNRIKEVDSRYDFVRKSWREASARRRGLESQIQDMEAKPPYCATPSCYWARCTIFTNFKAGLKE